MAEMAGQHRLHRVLGPVALSALGVGSIIGTGIFVLIGQVAHQQTGPALTLSFVVAGLASLFAALCYAEFASTVPVAGSAYTYGYATLGELMAWIIGWDLVLEYAVSSAAVAHGWTKYFQDLLKLMNLEIPRVLSDAPFRYDAGHFVPNGTWFDLPAIAITAVITVVLVVGIRESTWFNALMVAVKLGVVLFVIAVGAFYIDPDNWTPFAPFGYGGLSLFGHTVAGQSIDGRPVGMLAGAAIIFFAYIGFDAVSTHAEEAKRPERDVPIGILVSVVVCTVLYIAMSAVVTGMVPSNQIEVEAPVASAFAHVGLTWARVLVDVGAIAGMTSVLLVTMLSQPRILLAMARDGLLPERFFGAVHPHYKTPWKGTVLTGVVVAAFAAFLPLDVLADLVSIGTLMAFVIVCAAVLILRKTNPDAPRPFRVPLAPWIPLLGMGFCLMLMFSLPAANWWRLAAWLALGMGIYFGYGRWHSKLGRELRSQIALGGVSPAGTASDPTDSPPR